MGKTTSIRIDTNLFNDIKMLKSELFIESGGKIDLSLIEVLNIIISKVDLGNLKHKTLREWEKKVVQEMRGLKNDRQRSK